MQNPYPSESLKQNSLVNNFTNSSQPIFIPNRAYCGQNISSKSNQIPTQYRNIKGSQNIPIKLINQNSQIPFDTRNNITTNHQSITFNTQNPTNQFKHQVYQTQQKMHTQQTSNISSGHQSQNQTPKYPTNSNVINKQLNYVSEKPQSDMENEPYLEKGCSKFLIGIIALIALIGIILVISLAFGIGSSGPSINGPNGSTPTKYTLQPIDINKYPVQGFNLIVQKSLQVITPNSKIESTTNTNLNTFKKQPNISTKSTETSNTAFQLPPKSTNHENKDSIKREIHRLHIEYN